MMQNVRFFSSPSRLGFRVKADMSAGKCENVIPTKTRLWGDSVADHLIGSGISPDKFAPILGNNTSD